MGVNQVRKVERTEKRQVELLAVYSLQTIVSSLTIEGWDLKHPVMIRL